MYLSFTAHWLPIGRSEVKNSFKNVSHRVLRVFKVSVSPNHWTTECSEDISGTYSAVSVRYLRDLCEKFFAFLQLSQENHE